MRSLLADVCATIAYSVHVTGSLHFLFLGIAWHGLEVTDVDDSLPSAGFGIAVS